MFGLFTKKYKRSLEVAHQRISNLEQMVVGLARITKTEPSLYFDASHDAEANVEYAKHMQDREMEVVAAVQREK